ncbi:CHAP domain-containing protein [Aeromicrobium endophyticum]|uniref:CHAP domain-containing protein n=1 Tax=Aeromicrobium endophyticum TaxID=2292704 RepID=A0A371P532_9ACTN|nr:CHAP domain-containing protein [Aeromicrobium endophyticum]REK70640.1 CHAP domain-containing protein [Aeromicrobium endophyticum]
MCSAHRLARAAGALVLAIIIMVAGVVAAPAEAASSSTTLCKGFAQCAAKGRGDAGYAPVYRGSYWNMRPGHNCTNYVAYRLTNGRTVPRPPGADGSGTWGAAARKAGTPVSRTPRVGSVAWWKPRYHGASAGGHVAYVEAVRKDGSIVISEDHLGGTFMWRVLKRKGGAWPSGFIHFKDSDGSPSGKVLWARGEGRGAVRLSATANEPDVPAGQRDYLVTVGGPRETPGVESFRFSTEFFRFERLATLRSRGATVLYVYALNTPGTRGSDTLLGSMAVSVGG